MTTFRIDASEGPGTHVLILGVGDYPYLKDGSAQGRAAHRNMGQLSSPPVSALEMLRWVDSSLSNPQAPLKSIEVLVSAVNAPSFTDRFGLSQRIDSADWDNYEAAVTAWKERADSHPENVAIFYFCGHGMGDGINTYLLTGDAGRSSKLLRHGIHVSELRLAMGSCTATKQIYLIDACRNVDLACVLDPHDSSETGLPEVNPLLVFRGENPVLYSARQGEQAFGAPGQVSVFTKALLNGLNRCAVFRPRGREWVVSPQQLQRAIAALMEDFSGSPPCPADGISGQGFQLHVLNQPPEVILHVHLDNQNANESAVISYTSEGNTVIRQDSEHPWRTFVPSGACLIEASFNPAGRFTAQSMEFHMVPPFQNITLEVL
ncbi:caspase family protein [Pseudomonas viridiflava]|uniref:caspase family protein n=1 Tax=Pseudomonas viridiflava TaxID=33069 RepID=UPI002A6A615E|nr:caspase family protein [Pseudomonas viridiflava]MDY0917613.1 caspase family protein [Pseudomonas viridiflava]